MTKSEAKKAAWRAAYSSLKSMLDCGWPYQMVDDADPEESAKDLDKMHNAMEEITALCLKNGQRRRIE